MDSTANLTVTHRRYLGLGTARFTDRASDVSAAVELLSDVATEICIRSDGDEGRFVGLQEVDFTAPLYPGDVVEIEGRLIRQGTRSREIQFEARVLCRHARNLEEEEEPKVSTSAKVLDEPLVAIRAVGTCVVPYPIVEQHDDPRHRPVWGRLRRPPADPAAEIDD